MREKKKQKKQTKQMKYCKYRYLNYVAQGTLTYKTKYALVGFQSLLCLIYIEYFSSIIKILKNNAT